MIAMRSEFIGECARFDGLPEMLNIGQYVVPSLTREQQEKAIVSPASAFGGDVKPRLITQLLDDMDADATQLPLLQYCLRRLWNRAKSRASEAIDGSPVGDVTMTLEDYREIGELKNALANHAEDVFNTLNVIRGQIAERMFRSFNERRRVDQQHPGDSVQISALALIAGVSVAEVIQVAEIFSHPDCRFITSEPAGQLKAESVLSISHESLFHRWNRLQAWVEREPQSAKNYNLLEQTARLWKEDKSSLWGNPDIEHILDWKTKERPTVEWAKKYGNNFDLAMEFLNASQQAHEKLQQHERPLALMLVVMGLVIAGLSGWGAWERSKTKQVQTELTHKLNKAYAQNEELIRRLDQNFHPAPQVLIRNSEKFLQNELFSLECGEIVTISVGKYSLDSNFNIDYTAILGKVGQEKSPEKYTAPDTPGMDAIIITVKDAKTQKVVVRKSILIEIVGSIK